MNTGTERVVRVRPIMKPVSSRWARGRGCAESRSQEARGEPVKKRVTGTNPETGSVPDSAFPVGGEGRGFQRPDAQVSHLEPWRLLVEKSEQKGGFVHAGRKILLNTKKGAVAGPGRAEQVRARLNWIRM